MTDVPALFRPEMVCALLEGRKTQTRRPAWYVKTWPRASEATHYMKGPLGTRTPSYATASIVDIIDGGGLKAYAPTKWQSVKPGDLIWVRENIRLRPGMGQAFYDADDLAVSGEIFEELAAHVKRFSTRILPAVHMPRHCSRLTLFVDAVRCEPLQAVTEDDAVAEGMYLNTAHSTYSADHRKVWPDGETPREAFRFYYEHIHGPGTWEDNPDVVVTTFRRLNVNIDKWKARAP